MLECRKTEKICDLGVALMRCERLTLLGGGVLSKIITSPPLPVKTTNLYEHDETCRFRHQNGVSAWENIIFGLEIMRRFQISAQKYEKISGASFFVVYTPLVRAYTFYRTYERFYLNVRTFHIQNVHRKS
jgi:hypothetical protein